MTTSLTQAVRSARDVPGLHGYELVRELNHGYFGRVYEAVELAPGNARWAVKLIEKRRLNDRQRQNVLNEVNIMRQLAHKNVIRLKDFQDLPLHYVLVMELMLGGDLFERLEKQTNFREEDAREIIVQVAEGVKYLHDLNIAHRDIKIENLMFTSHDSRLIKIGDFGLAKQLVNNSDTITPCGTKEYMAPEMLDGTQLYSKKVDIWALGCLTYIVLFGGFPFYNDQDDRGRTVMSLKEKIHNGRYLFPQGQELGANVSDASRDFIRRCLVVDPTRRFSIEQVLAHPWVKTRQDNSPVLASPAILREMPGTRAQFNMSMAWLRDHILPGLVPAASAPAPAPAQPSMNDIHQQRLGQLASIDPKEIQRRRNDTRREREQQAKRKIDAAHAQASPLDGAGEEVQPPRPQGTPPEAMSTSPLSSLMAPLIPSNKKPNNNSSSSDVTMDMQQ